MPKNGCPYRLVHELVDPASIPSGAVGNVKRDDVVVVHLQAANVDVRLQITLELLLATSIVDVRIGAATQAATVRQVFLPGIVVRKPLKDNQPRKPFHALYRSFEYLTLLSMRCTKS